eukprot:scaffold57154_cov17-Prasinocladus_malaysianus.AAC.2
MLEFKAHIKLTVPQAYHMLRLASARIASKVYISLHIAAAAPRMRCKSAKRQPGVVRGPPMHETWREVEQSSA